MLNKTILMGRFTADPELRRTQSGTATCSFTLAVERDGKPDENGKRATDFPDFVAWRGTAEFICKYFRKGRMAVVEGRVQTRTWKDKHDQTRKSTEVVVDNIYFGDSKRDDASGYEPYGGGQFSEMEDDGELPFN